MREKGLTLFARGKETGAFRDGMDQDQTAQNVKSPILDS